MAVPSKSHLRKEALARRRALPPATRDAAGARILAHVLSLPEYPTARTVCCYVSVGSEVPTPALLARVLADGKRLVVPVTDPVRADLDLALVTDLAALAPGPHEIPEPPAAGRAFVAVQEVDLILVPGVAFDARGHRLGYGRGYYDRLLARAPGVPKVGLAFATQVVPRIPHEPHDVRLHHLVTEEDVVACRDEGPG